MNRKLKILLLCNYDPYNAATVCDHINALVRYSAHEVVVHSWLVAHGGELAEDFPLEYFDAVILHYSLFLAVDAYVAPKTRKRLEGYNGVKAIFLQDEYRFVNSSIERINRVGFDVIFTCVPECAIEHVYPAHRLPGVERINVLTGYVPEALLHYRPLRLDKRRLDVSYRGRRYPAWHGRLGLEKWMIAKRFSTDARRFGLKCDISYKESDRLYGAAWVNLLQQSKAVLGVESGASVFDFTGEISGKVESVELLLGDRVKYEKLHQQYFADLEDKIPLTQISPRIFEAIALRTLCILYEGEYSGVLKPWRHYVPLKKDHSNMPEVVAVLRNSSKMAEVIANAYAEIALNPKYSYSSFVDRVDSVMMRCFDTTASRRADNIANKQAKGVDTELTVAVIQSRVPIILISNPHGLWAMRGLLLRVRHFVLRHMPTRVKQILRVLVQKR